MLLLKAGIKQLDSLLAKRIKVLNRTFSSNASLYMATASDNLLNAACYRFKSFIEQAVSEMSFLSNHPVSDDLSYLDLFTHVVRGYTDQANEAINGFSEVFSLGNMTDLLVRPGEWLSRAHAHAQQETGCVEDVSCSLLQIRLSRLMGNGRKCYLGIEEGDSGRSRFMLVFHTKPIAKVSPIDYIEAAYHLRPIKEAC